MCCILFIPALFFKGFADLKITAQDRPGPAEVRQPFVKCLEIKNGQIDDFASDNNLIVLTETAGDIRLLNSSDYFQTWNIQIGNKLETIPYPHGSNILLLSYTNGNELSKQQTIIRQINSFTGITDWITHLDISGQSLLLRDADSRNIMVVSDSLKIRQIDSKTGKIIRSIDLKGKLKNYTSGKGSFYILTTEDKLFEISTTDGSILSETEFKSENISIITFAANSLFTGDAKGGFYKLAENSKVRSRLFRTGGEISFIEPYGNDLLVVSNDNFLYYYSTEKEKVLWKKRLPGRVILKPVISGNSIFVTTSVEPVINIFKRIDGVLVNQINLGENYIIKKMTVNENGIDILTTAGLLKFGINCQK